MATSGTSACLTTEQTRPNGREPVVDTREGLAGQASEASSPTKEDPPPLRSVHTSNFSPILQELGVSVLVTTYQAGKPSPG